jgi:hypothetical protein
MRKFRLILGAVCILLAPLSGLAADAPPRGPVAHLPEAVFEFQPVVEGTPLVHEFSLRNQGDAPLEIIDLKSG